MVVQAAATIALGLLGLAGIAKVVDPQPTSGAMSAARLPSQLWLIRSLGLLELTAAFAGLTLGAVAAVPGAVLYLGFAVFTLIALRGSRPLRSCGCFGREDTPPSWIHVAFNAVSALALASVVISGGPTIPWYEHPAVIFGYMGLAGLGVFAAYLMLTALPQTLSVGNQ